MEPARLSVVSLMFRCTEHASTEAVARAAASFLAGTTLFAFYRAYTQKQITAEIELIDKRNFALSATLQKIFLIMGVCFLLAIVGNLFSCRYSQICIGNEQPGNGVLSK